MGKKVANAAMVLATIPLRAPAILGEQHEISIGDDTRTARQKRRDRILDAARSERPQSTVVVAACGECGAPATADARGLVIAQCGCNGGMQRVMMATSSGAPQPYGTSSVPLPPTFPGGDLVANPPGGPVVVPDPFPGCYPAALCDRRTGMFRTRSWSEMLRASRMAKCPYVDPYYDSVYMDTIYSERTTVTVAAGTVDIELQPQAGTFALFYLEIIAVDPTTQVQQVDWTAAQPRVEGCPVPCGSGDIEALAQFVTKVPEACCGTPLVAWLDEASRNTPLIVPFTNRQAAGDLTVQLRGRGYCCNERIC